MLGASFTLVGASFTLENKGENVSDGNFVYIRRRGTIFLIFLMGASFRLENEGQQSLQCNLQKRDGVTSKSLSCCLHRGMVSEEGLPFVRHSTEEVLSTALKTTWVVVVVFCFVLGGGVIVWDFQGGWGGR